MVQQPESHPTQQSRTNAVLQLLQERPLIFWGGVWTFVIFVAGLAMLGLTNPGSVDSPDSEPVAPVVTAVPAQEPTPVVPDSTLPLWLMGTLALGCAGGSLLISRRLADPDKTQKTLKRIKPYPDAKQSVKKQSVKKQKQQKPAKPAPAPKPTAAQQPKPSAPLAPVPAQAFAVATPSPSQHPNQVPSGAVNRSQPQAIDPVVTVVPEEESHPLDWGESGLADMFDIRKRQPLSSLIIR